VAAFLIAEGADVNRKDDLGLPPLWLAASVGHADLAELLIANGANVNFRSKNGSTLLWAAALHGHADIVELLLAKGITVGASDAALDLAEQKGHTEIVDLLKQYLVGQRPSTEWQAP